MAVWVINIQKGSLVGLASPICLSPSDFLNTRVTSYFITPWSETLGWAALTSDLPSQQRPFGKGLQLYGEGSMIIRLLTLGRPKVRFFLQSLDVMRP